MEMKDIIIKENGITDEQLQEYKDAFDLMDKDGDGVIKLEEIEKAMKSISFVPTEAEIRDIVYVEGFKDDDNVEYWEFLDFISEEYAHSDLLRDINNAFKVMDRSGKGEIGPADIVYLMKQLGEPITLDEAKEMIKESDTDGDGKISRKEFMAVFISTRDEDMVDEDELVTTDSDTETDT